jgi:hypothetical protein
MNIHTCLAFGVAALLMWSADAWSFSLEARPGRSSNFGDSRTDVKRAFPFLDRAKPVHEVMTRQSLSCEGNGREVCLRLIAQSVYPDDVLDGVRWNDFPAQYLTHNSTDFCKGKVLRVENNAHLPCFGGLLLRAMASSFEDGDAPDFDKPWAGRGHFLDLQFLHAMAPAGQSAERTKTLIKRWAQFAYLVSLGKVSAEADVTKLGVPGMNEFFPPGARRVKDLMDYRSGTRMQGIALGQILHIVQDSFARCHAERDSKGAIIRFHTYVGQDSDEHRKHDESETDIAALLERPLNPVAFGRRLLELRAERADWGKVSELLDEYFVLVNESARATPGQLCEGRNTEHVGG